VVELSGLEVLELTKETDLTLRGSYVNNIYSLGRAQLLRFRKPGGEDALLVASPSHGVWVSAKASERMETSEFTSKLRAELERAKLTKVEQVQLDRIFVLSFEGKSDKKMVVELMPPGNIVVMDGDGRITLVEREVRSPRRRLVKGLQYEAPAQSRLDPRGLTTQELVSACREEKTAGKALGKHVSLPRKYVAEVLRRVGVDEGAPSADLEALAGRASEVVRCLVENAEVRPQPCLCNFDGREEIFATEPSGLEVLKKGKSMTELCDDVLFSKLGEVEVEPTAEDSKRQELLATVSKLREEEQNLLSGANRLRIAAALAAKAPTLEEALETARKEGVAPRQKPQSNSAVASLLFDKAKESETKAADARAAAQRLEKKVPRAGEGQKERTRKISRTKKEWYEKFRWFLTSQGKLAIGGRDAQSNSILVRRHTEQGDVVYHADLFGSPFFVLKGGLNQSEEEIRETAQATVAFSSAWKTGLGSADAYWVNPDQISTAAPSGEFLAKGSFAIKGKKNFVNRNLVEVAVGRAGDGRLMSGPEAAISKQCTSYVVLVPHREKGSETAKKVLAILGKQGGENSNLDLDDVARALPPGGGKVARRHGLG